jgi:hypothetical protein
MTKAMPCSRSDRRAVIVQTAAAITAHWAKQSSFALAEAFDDLAFAS